MKLFAIFVCLAAFCGGAQAAKVLALLENMAVKETHSIYFKRLADAGLEVTYKIADDPSIVIKKDDKHMYDHLVIFSPTVEELGQLGESLSLEDIVEFIEDGGNVLMAGSPRGGDVITDHENLLDILTGCSFSYIILFSYSHNPEDPITEYPHDTGKNTLLITGLQARNNARVIFTGSMDLFSDEMFSSLVEKAGSGAHGVPSGNADLAKALSAWCFQMAGVVGIDSVEHHLASSSNQSSTMKQETPAIFILAHLSNLIRFATLALFLNTLIQQISLANADNHLHLSVFMFASLCYIPFISWFAIHLFLNFLSNTSDIPVPELVVLGAILIISGLLLLLSFQKSLTTLIIASVIYGAGVGVSGAAVTSADRSFVSDYSGPWYQDVEFLCSFDFLVGSVLCVVLQFAPAITIDSAIFLLIGMELVIMLLAPLISLI